MQQQHTDAQVALPAYTLSACVSGAVACIRCIVSYTDDHETYLLIFSTTEVQGTSGVQTWLLQISKQPTFASQVSSVT
jgi:hypothetical protein